MPMKETMTYHNSAGGVTDARFSAHCRLRHGVLGFFWMHE